MAKSIEKKYRKEAEEKEKAEKEKQLNQRFCMLRWITSYIEENQERWDKIQKEKEKEIEKDLEAWNKAKRLEKIKELKKKWGKKEKSKK